MYITLCVLSYGSCPYFRPFSTQRKVVAFSDHTFFLYWTQVSKILCHLTSYHSLNLGFHVRHEEVKGDFPQGIDEKESGRNRASAILNMNLWNHITQLPFPSPKLYSKNPSLILKSFLNSTGKAYCACFPSNGFVTNRILAHIVTLFRCCQ